MMVARALLSWLPWTMTTTGSEIICNQGHRTSSQSTGISQSRYGKVEVTVTGCNDQECQTMNRESNLYPVGSVAACDANFGRKKEGKFLLCDRFWSLPVRSFDFLDGLLKKEKEKKQPFTSKTEPPPSRGIASVAYHVSEGSARALAGCVVLEDGRVVDQLANIIAAWGEKKRRLKNLNFQAIETRSS